MPEIKTLSLSPANSTETNTQPQLVRQSTTNGNKGTSGASAHGDVHTGVDYAEFFDNRQYMQSRFGGGVENPNSPQPLPFQMSCFHEFYELFHSRWDASSARLLEFGGGPSIYPLISACPHVSEIVFCDYTPSLLKEVQLWNNKDPKAHDWSYFFRYQVNNLEGKAGQGVVLEREELLRERIASLEHCDVTKPKVVNQHLGRFDIVSTSCCIESVASTIEEFEQFLRRLANVTMLGGHIVMLVSIGMSWYSVSGEKFEHLAVTLESTRSSLENAGFVVEMERYHPLEEYRKALYADQGNCQGKAVFAGRRVK